MEDNEIVAPIEDQKVEEITEETPAVVEETKETGETEVVTNAEEKVEEEAELETEEPDYEDRIKGLEEGLNNTNARFDGLITEQEKIVNILEKISEKILTRDTPNAEAAAKNDIEEEITETEETKVEAEEVVENEMKVGDKDNSGVDNEPTPQDEAKEEVVEEAKAEETAPAEAESEETEEQAVPEEKDAPAKKTADKKKKSDKKVKKENEMTDEQLDSIVERIKNEILDAKVEAPAIEETAEEVAEETAPEVATNYLQRYNDQVAAAWDYHREKNIAAGEKLRTINQFNYDQKVKNDSDAYVPMTIESLADFVLPAEIDRTIHGFRSNYTPFLNKLNYQQTSALQFAYATRVGDIDMKNVKFCDDGQDGNLKPIETYELTRGIAQMEELAAVTPICDNATKYLAADILADVAAGYRNSYDRGLAQLAIVRFQQAIDTTGQAIEYDPLTAVDALVDFVKATTLVSPAVVNGEFLFNARTKAAILENLLRSGNDGLGATAFTQGDTPSIWGYPYTVVPNDLLPTLGTDEVKQFKALNNQTGVLETVDITSPVFYGDFSEYRGKVSGGLSYTVSTEAMYEVTGASGSVEYRSAYQRNELVIRGSYYRGGYFADATVIAGLTPASS